jgi:hypothetical protein
MGCVAKLLFLVAYPARALAASAADSLEYLLTVVTDRAEEHPTLQAVEAIALLAALMVLLLPDGVPATG